jgi:ABC-type lipoprotein release transport system permease subunit
VHQAFSWFLALRYFASRWVNVVAVLGVAFAVWALVLVDAIFSGFVGNIREDVRRTSPDLMVTDLPHDTGFEALRQVIAATDGVAAVAPRLRHFGVFYRLVGETGAPNTEALDFDNIANSFVQLLGIDLPLEREVTPVDEWFARSGRPVPDYGTGERASMLRVPDDLEWRGRGRAGLGREQDSGDYRAAWPGLLLSSTRMLYQRGLQPGDPIDVVSASFAGPVPEGSRTAPGSVQTNKTRCAFAGAFETGHRLFDGACALVPIEMLRTSLGHDRADLGTIDLVTDVAIRLRQDADPAATAARLLAAVRAALPPGSAPSVIDWQEQNAVFLQAVAHERSMMLVVLFVVMLIAAFLIYATQHMLVMQKIKDIGILCAVGGTPGGIGTIFLLSGFVIGTLGGAAGAGTGAATALWMNAALDLFGIEVFPKSMYDLQQIPYRINPEWIAIVFGVAVLLSLLVAWLPARRAARLQPIEALAHE